MFTFYGGDDANTIKERFTYILNKLRSQGKVKKSENKAKSETFRYLVNRVFYQMKQKEMEIKKKFRGRKK